MKQRILLVSWLLLGLSGSLLAQAQIDVSAMPADTNKVFAWIDLSKTSMQTSFPEAKAYGDSALLLATELDFEKGAAFAHRQIATACYYGSKLSDALYHYQHALDYYQATGQKLNAAKIQNNMGLVKRNQGKIAEAMTDFFASLAVKEEIGDSTSIANSFSTIGETYSVQNNHEQAGIYFEKALALFKAVGNRPMENTLLLNLGGLYQEMGELEKAQEYVKESKEYFAVNGPTSELARAHYILGNIYLKWEDWKKSEDSYRRSKVYFDELGSAMRSNGCVIHLAELAFIQEKYAACEKLALEALAVAQTNEFATQIATSYSWLAKSNRAQGKYAQAYRYLEATRAKEDSILNETNNRTIAELEEKYQSELKERQLAQLQATNQLNSLRLKKQQERQLLLLIFAALVVLIALLLLNRYRLKKRSHAVLMEKNAIIQASLEEKEVLLREIHHRVKNSLQFIASLLNLQARHVHDPQTLQVLNEGKNRINSMSLVHQKLYQEDNLTGVDMTSYISNLVNALSHAYQIDLTRVSVQTDLDDLLLDIDTAIPIGLILNELITNIFKYAFKDRDSGIVQICLKEREGHLRLQIKDDGVGLESLDQLENSSQFGFELIRSLAAKIKASILVENQSGVSVTLDIQKYKKT